MIIIYTIGVKIIVTSFRRSTCHKRVTRIKTSNPYYMEFRHYDDSEPLVERDFEG